jgi:hypothetical protein
MEDLKYSQIDLKPYILTIIIRYNITDTLKDVAKNIVRYKMFLSYIEIISYLN